MERVTKLLVAVLLFTISISYQLMAGTTGKIAGSITDQKTGEPLFGASVVVAGTKLGAASDIEGHYTILEVPPGIYTLQVSYIGYRKVTVNDIRVNIDQTARVDISIESESIEVGEMVVTAKRNPVRPDVATSVVAVSSQEIASLPVANVQDVLGMQAGITIDKDNVMIRGSNADQSLFLVDGITMRDPRNNMAISKVALSTIKEISIERGGFNAEYGQVQAGIVNIVTNEGAPRGYSGSIQVRVTPPGPKYYRGNGIPDVQDPNSYWLRSYLDPAVAWTGTNTPESQGGWDEYTRKKYLPFVGWNAIAQQLNTDNNPDNDLTPAAAQRVFLYETRKKSNNDLADYEIDAGFGGPVPYVSEMLGNLRFFTSYRRQRDVLLIPLTRPDYTDYDWRMVLNTDLNQSMRLRLTGQMGNIATMEDNWNKGLYMHYPNDIANGTGGNALFNIFSDWTYSLTDISTRSLAAKFTHNISKNSYYEASIEYLRRHYDSRPPAMRDTSALFEVVPGFYESSNPFGYDPNAAFGEGVIVYAGEQQSLARDNSVASSMTAKVDFISQVNFNNLFKGGLEYVYNDLNLDYGFIQMQTQGLKYNSRVLMHNFPVRVAGYIQDKLETKGFTLNAGLRLDYSDSKTDWWDFSTYDPNFISSNFNENRVFLMRESKPQWQLSPRLGISHPISENAKLFFNYGHFKQMPQYEALLRYDRRPDGSLVRIGDPNLILAKTISYELGFDYILPENILLQITAFYRDISDQQNTTQYQSIGGTIYNLTTSTSYSDIRGFEVTLRKSTGWLSGFANYTYQVSSNGSFGSTRKYQDPKQQKDWDENTINLYQTRYVPSPNARMNINVMSPDDWGPKLVGHNVFGGLLVNLLMNWSQGGYTTYNPNNATGIVNNVQYVNYFNATLRFGKTINFNAFSLQIFADCTNLFNTLRLRDTGDRDYRASLHLPSSQAYSNIPGDDKLGDYREPGVEWQPMVYQKTVDLTRPASSSRPIYFEGSTGKYWQYTNNQWAEVPQSRIDQINKDKAYIEMPNLSTFWFLNPRTIIFGARLSFNID